MSGPARGIDALLLAPLPSVPARRGLVSKRLADHIHGFLIWMANARARSENTVKAYGEDVRMFVAFCERAGITEAEDVTFHHVEAFGAVLRAHLGQRESLRARDQMLDARHSRRPAGHGARARGGGGLTMSREFDVVIFVRGRAPGAGAIRVLAVSDRADDLLGRDQEVPPQEWDAIRVEIERRGWRWTREEDLA